MLRLLEANEINQVLHDNFSIWSPGLDRSRYRHYQWWQLKHDWGRRNLEYFGFFNASGKLVASCKRYKLLYQAGARLFRIAGIGAVFVPERERGQAYGLKMLEQMEQLCREDGYDATFLNSDIDPDYYARLGYCEFEAAAFSVELSRDWLKQSIKKMDSLSDYRLDETFNVRSLNPPDFAEMCRHHERWLARREYGLKRSAAYWHYKLGRELYLFKHSALNWPKLDIITDNYERFVGGYALIEQSGPYLRVLEVIGPEYVRNSLWAQILRLAERRKALTLRGWEVQKPPLAGLTLRRRDWSFPMICALGKEMDQVLDSWLQVHPPGMLELDHF